MAPKNKLNTLKKQREETINKLLRFKNYYDRNVAANTFDKDEITTRFDDCQLQFKLFNDIQSEIELLDENETDVEREQFEDTYYSLVAQVKKIIMPDQPASLRSSVEEPTSSNMNVRNNMFLQPVNLPLLNLPHFKGKYNEYTHFRDTFDSLINKNINLDEVQKFHYLISCLEGDALELVQSLEVTNNNYGIAWELLRERYDNKRLIVNSHLKALFELPPIQRENAIALRHLLDAYNKNIRALRSLGLKVDTWDEILIYLLTSKLDFASKRDWENKSKPNQMPTLDDFSKFLNNRCQVLENLYTRVNDAAGSNSNFKSNLPRVDRKILSNISTNKQLKCYYCQQTHCIFYCNDFLKLNNQKRLNEVKRLKLCLNCLRPYSREHHCLGSCKICHHKHNTLLHIDNRTPVNNQETKQHEVPNNPKNNNNDIVTVNAHSVQNNDSLVLLATANLLIQNDKKQYIECRALLDGGSQSNFITAALAKQLKLPVKSINLPVMGIGEAVTNIQHKVDAKVKAKHSNYTEQLDFLVLDTITGNIPSATCEVSRLQFPNNIQLADEKFYKSAKIDMLLGASIFYKLLSVGQIDLGRGQPKLQNTKLGWIVTGTLFIREDSISQCLLVNSNSIQTQLEKFWSLEDVQYNNPSVNWTKDERYCEDHFVKNYTRDEMGRFTVALPLKENYTQLGDTFEIAKKRFIGLEHRLQKDQTLHALYSKFLQEYKDLGHMTKLSTEQIQSDTNVYYLPHHGVLKPDSQTTKLRVVFNASAKSSTNIALNDILHVGPVIQDDLFSILIRFRKHNYVIKGDITKMYRQVNIKQEQRKLQRIIWRENPSDELEHYELNTVTYGTAPASFLAIRALYQLAIDNKVLFPQASEVIKKDFYVDDMISGASTVENLLTLKTEVESILKAGGFVLTQWKSNIINTDNQQSKFYITDNELTKTLGVLWNPNIDAFQFSVNIKFINQTITKRVVLSIISQVFDPLGIIGPVVVQAKMLLQLLWKLKLDWDDQIPDVQRAQFCNFFNELQNLSKITIPRHILLHAYTGLHLHGFSDASMQAYGACIYARTVDTLGKTYTALICSKSRVAPLKVVSLPRLELCGALLLARLMNKVQKALNLTINEITFWTDSNIVLAWLAHEPSHWKSFIANRVAEIQDLSSVKQWQHVPSATNPADLVSRGCDPSQLVNADLWWLGPSWLRQNKEKWPEQSKPYNTLPDIPERRKSVKVVNIVVHHKFELFEKFSNLNKLIRVTALCIRFFKNIKKKPDNRNTGKLQVSELERAIKQLVKTAQREEFSPEIANLEKVKSLARNSKLLNLNPFLDSENVMRVGGRLKNSNLTYEHKHPMILPANHALTKLILRHEHVRTFHGGVQMVLSAVRTNYWPLNAKNHIKRIIHECITCFKNKPRNLAPIMGELPASRVVPSRPFSTTGVDFAGPFFIKERTFRNRKLIKIYICVFICFATKAIHIELAGDLSTPTFLNALKRFFARRGLSRHIWSDNGTNFTGASNKLNDLNNIMTNLQKDETIQNYLLENRVTWHFIPPRTPHFGGLWESAIKSIKSHLIRAIGMTNLSYEQFHTIITQIEGTLNSRPLCQLSNDPDDLEALTPGHFLVGCKLNTLPEEDVQQVPINRLDKYQDVLRITQYFWKRWSAEYLHTLQQRNKWLLNDPKILKPGLMVLLREENVPPLQWKIGRILETHPGQDGIVRVVTVQTSSGVLKRGFSKVCVLPIDN